VILPTSDVVDIPDRSMRLCDFCPDSIRIYGERPFHGEFSPMLNIPMTKDIMDHLCQKHQCLDGEHMVSIPSKIPNYGCCRVCVPPKVVSSCTNSTTGSGTFLCFFVDVK
jgi:hypothetical protein